MKKLILIFFVGLFAGTANINAQEISGETSKVIEPGKLIEPIYPGGMAAFYKYVEKGVKRRHMPSKSGRLIALFTVEKDGTISNIKIMEGIEQKFDDRIVKLISESEGWTPGYIDGLPVRASYKFPITINVH